MTSSCLYSSDQSFAPWDFSCGKRGGQYSEMPREGAREASLPIQGLHSIFQAVSAVDGDRCPMTPTCSNYGLQAMDKHGPLVGWMMIVDRLLRESDEQDLASHVVVAEEYRTHDPVDANDFWWFSTDRLDK